MHACGITHCDIKIQNALVFESSVSTAESWRIKLTDFGNALIVSGKSSIDQRVPDAIQDTPLYRAPELDKLEQDVVVGTLGAIDVWQFGMLLWQVIIEGDYYADGDGNEINAETMKTLRNQRLVGETAWTACSKFIRSNHFEEQAEFRQGVQSALQATLSTDPRERPEPSKLLDDFQRLLDSQ